jgi:soluble lytic murein transglycosylase-like protein
MPALLLGFTCSAAAFNGQSAVDLCEREMLQAAHEHSIPVAILYAVALTESGKRGAARAYAMNVDGRSISNESLAEALLQFSRAQRSGARFIDVGCMQVNYQFHGRKFQSVEEMFDPHSNVDYAATLLNSLRAREGSWTAAVARYHAGPHNQRAQRSYVCTVIGNMIAGGLGAWTPQSATFCH